MYTLTTLSSWKYYYIAISYIINQESNKTKAVDNYLTTKNLTFSNLIGLTQNPFQHKKKIHNKINLITLFFVDFTP